MCTVEKLSAAVNGGGSGV